MTGLTASPRVLKAGLVLVDAGSGAIGRVIALQYNPDQLTRSFQPQTIGGAEREGPLRFKGPAVETYRLEAELDATDQLAAGDAATISDGLQPQLAALEMLLHPPAAALTARANLADLGMMEIAPIEAPLALFAWSRNRVAPVRVTDLSITEEAFDPSLNPIRAKVSLTLRVLSVDDLGFRHRGGHAGCARADRSGRAVTDPIAAFRAGAGLDISPFDTASRYHGVGLATWTGPDGVAHAYVRRRVPPDPATLATMSWGVVQEGDRADLLAYRLLGDSAAWWRLADANGVADPATLADTPGTRIRVAFPPGVGTAPDE